LIYLLTVVGYFVPIT